MTKYKPGVSRGFNRAKILAAAVEVARVPGGWSLLTRKRIAEQAKCSEGLVSRYLGDMKDARRDVMKILSVTYKNS